MAISIKSPEADRLARELSEITGESLTRTITVSLRERLERLRGRKAGLRLADEIMEIGSRCSTLKILDGRPPAAILGYDGSGLPR